MRKFWRKLEKNKLYLLLKNLLVIFTAIDMVDSKFVASDYAFGVKSEASAPIFPPSAPVRQNPIGVHPLFGPAWKPA